MTASSKASNRGGSECLHRKAGGSAPTTVGSAYPRLPDEEAQGGSSGASESRAPGHLGLDGDLMGLSGWTGRRKVPGLPAISIMWKADKI